MKLVAMKRLRYPSGPEGKEYQPGQEFTALSDRDAKALTLVRAARAVDAPAPKSAAKASPEPIAAQPNLLTTASMKAEDEAPTPAPRRYRRRDMQPED